MGKPELKKPTKTQYNGLVAAFIVFSLGGGYFAATQPKGEWQETFSWHPFLMTCGMVGFAGISSVTKKLGGYANTKLHAIVAWLSVFASMGGMYAIYTHKNNIGKSHLATTHGIVGFTAFASCIGLGIVGSVVLHPDFGVDKTNKTIRFAHKMGARVVLMMAWVTAVFGLNTLTSEPLALASYGLPLLVLAPFTLM